MKTPYYSDESCTIYHGEARCILDHLALPENAVDAIVTDPPYSSGGLHRSDRTARTDSKYVLNGTGISRPNFSGDNKDQRSFLAWATLWLADLLLVSKPSAPLLLFTDWRQLPLATDAIQAAGWIWRGIIPWDKTAAARPAKGWFRAQCEYVLSATNGSMGLEQDRSGDCLEGIWREAAHDKHHITGKPLQLLRFLVNVTAPGGLIIDPFMGGGTTLLAAKQTGRRAIGIEIEESYCEISAKRLARELPLSTLNPQPPTLNQC